MYRSNYYRDMLSCGKSSRVGWEYVWKKDVSYQQVAWDTSQNLSIKKINHTRFIIWRSGSKRVSKKPQFLTSLITTSVRKKSFTFHMSPVTAVRARSCKPNVPWCRETSWGCDVESVTVPWFPFIWRWDRANLSFILKTTWCSQQKHSEQDDGKHIIRSREWGNVSSPQSIPKHYSPFHIQ